MKSERQGLAGSAERPTISFGPNVANTGSAMMRKSTSRSPMRRTHARATTAAIPCAAIIARRSILAPGRNAASAKRASRLRSTSGTERMSTTSKDLRIHPGLTPRFVRGVIGASGLAQMATSSPAESTGASNVAHELHVREANAENATPNQRFHVTPWLRVAQPGFPRSLRSLGAREPRR